MSLRTQTARRKLNRHNLPWQKVETAAEETLTATSDHLGINHDWTFDYHYCRMRAAPTIVLKAKHRDLPHAVAVKYLHQTGQGQPSPAQSEFATLSELHSKLGPAHDSVVTRPFVSTRQCYACEWVHLPSMKTVLLAGALSAARRQSCVETAAAKLRLIHDAVGVSSRPLSTDPLVRRLQNTGNTSQAWVAAVEKFVELSQELDGQMVPHGPIHADFTPGNILVGPERCVIFDFGRHDENGPVYSDMMYFLVYVIAYCTFGSNKSLQGRLHSDIETFIRAYGSQDAQGSKMLFYFYLNHLLNRWRRHEDKSREMGHNFHLSAYERFAARRMAQLSAGVMRHCF